MSNVINAVYLMTGDELRVLKAEADEPLRTDGDGAEDGHDGDRPTTQGPHQSQAIQQLSATQRPPSSGRSFSPTSRLSSPDTVVGTRYTQLEEGDNIELQPIHAPVHTKPAKIYPRLQ